MFILCFYSYVLNGLFTYLLVIFIVLGTVHIKVFFEAKKRQKGINLNN